jgi:hypothetical protein
VLEPERYLTTPYHLAKRHSQHDNVFPETGGMIPYLRRLVAFIFQGVLARAALVVADRKDVQGFAVYREPGGDLTDGIRRLQKLRGALALIQRLDARRFRRLQRDMPTILLSDTPTEYVRYARVAVLNARAVREQDEASLSGTLVELGAIARILRLLGARLGREHAHRVERRAAKERDAFFVTLVTAGVGGGESLKARRESR